jgi:hypothetical protein
MKFEIDEFYKIEQEFNVFKIRVNGVLIWERIRFDLYRKLSEKVGAGKAVYHTERSIRNKVRGLFTYLLNTLKKNPFFIGKKEIVVFGHPRRKQDENGVWWDIYCDPIYKNIDLDYVHFETPYSMEHKKPASTRNMKYLDIVNILVNLPLPKQFPKLKIINKNRRKIAAIEKSISEKYGVSINIWALIRESLQERLMTRWIYKFVLKKIQPKIVFVVVSYTKETLIEVCKDLGIPVVELQHGTINNDHVGYNYPGGITKKTFPDFFFSFGAYWLKQVNLPIDDKKQIIHIGYPYMDIIKEKYSSLKKENIILFLSQGTIGEDLSKFAVEVNNSFKEYKVVYKLHPGEYNQWKKIYPWLVDTNIEVIDSDNPPLYELFSKSKIQIGVSSTALYEGLSFGLQTFIYRKNGWQRLTDLTEQNLAIEINDVLDLVNSLGSINHKNSKKDINSIFKTNSLNNFKEGLDWVLEQTNHG